MLRQDGLLERVVDGDAADVARFVGVAVDELQQRGSEVVEHAAETGMGSQVHRDKHRPKVDALWRA